MMTNRIPTAAHLFASLLAVPLIRPSAAAHQAPGPECRPVHAPGRVPGQAGGGKGRWITLPEEAPGTELAWMKAYTPKCRGWLNPQTWLPDHVDRE